MDFVAPDILSDVCALSLGLKGLGMGLGVLLWVFGWRWHRFWVVLGATVLAGVIGLMEAPAWKTHPLAAALLLAVARGMEARQKLAEAEGGSLSSEEVARLLGISKTAALKRLEAGRLLAWREERLQAARFPRWQFDEHGQVLAGFKEVLDGLHQDPGLDAWGKLLFFLQTKSSLGGKRPLDLLRQGKIRQVCQAAQAYAE